MDVVGVKYVADKAMLEAFYQELYKDNIGLGKSVDNVNKKYEDLGDDATSDLKSIDAQTKKLKTDTDQQTAAVNKQVSAYRGVGNEAKKAGGALSKLGPMIATAFALDKVLQLGKNIVAITAEFQKFEAVLTNTLGSSSAAQGAMSMIVDFAAKTPFAVNELTSSFVKLANQGFIPTAEEMRKLGDLAASQGKGFDQLTEAIIDAQTGEFERLKEFGIRATKEGDNVKFNFKGVETQTKFTADAMREYILTLGDLEGVSGGMAAISATLTGKLSNAGDAIDQLFLKIGNGSDGVLTQVIDVFTEIVENVDQLGPFLTSLTDVWLSLFDSIEQVVGALFDVSGEGVTVEGVIQGIGKAMAIAQIPVKEMVAFLKLNVDALRLLLNEGKKVMNFFGAEFEIDTSLSIDTLKKDIESMKDIATLKDIDKKQNQKYFDDLISEIKGAQALDAKRIEERAKAAERMDKMAAQETEKQKKAREKAAAEALKAEQDYQKLLIANMKEGRGKELAELEFKYQAEREKLKGNHKALEQLEIQHQKEILDIMAKGRIEQMQGPGAVTPETVKKDQKKITSEWEEGEAERRKKQDASQEEQLDKAAKKRDKKKQDELDLAQAKEEILKTTIDAGFQIADIRRQARLDKDLADIDKQRELELSNVELTEEGKAAIEAKFAAQEAELKKKKATRDKLSAIFEATIAGALAVTKLLATPPLAIAAGVAAAAQIAIIAAQPIPQFREGVIDLQGPGTGTSDSIHARLSKGESVSTAARTKQYKAELMAIRDGKLEDFINTNYVLPVIKKVVEQRDTASNLANSFRMQNVFDDSGIVDGLKRIKPATSEDIKQLGSTISKAMSDAAYINSKMWKPS